MAGVKYYYDIKIKVKNVTTICFSFGKVRVASKCLFFVKGNNTCHGLHQHIKRKYNLY